MSDYHMDWESGISKTMLGTFVESHREFYETYITKKMPRKEPAKRMIYGSIGHAVVLENKTHENMIGIYPADCINSAGGLIGPKAAKFREQSGSRFCLKNDEVDEVVAFIGAVNSHPLIIDIKENAVCEQEQRVCHDGLWLKCKPDAYIVRGDRVTILDLKFMEDISPTAFARSAKRLSYWLQDAHYSLVVAQGREVAFGFVAVETKYPFRVHSYSYSQRQREMARDKHAAILKDLRSCFAAKCWDDDWSGEIPYDWKLADVSEELEVWNG